MNFHDLPSFFASFLFVPILTCIQPLGNKMSVANKSGKKDLLWRIGYQWR